MHVVADPNVLVSAVVSPGGVSAQLFEQLVVSPVRFVVDPLLLDEVERVLARPKFGAISPAQRARYLTYLARVGHPVTDPAGTDGQLVERDPGDDCLIRLVVDDPRRILVTGDPHLLELDQTYPVVSPRALLDRLRG